MQFGQDQVRGFFSDIVTGTDHPLPYRAFFGINTTLTVVMLMGAALLFFVCVSYSARQGVTGKIGFFQCSQVVFFIYLASDERLLIHEKMAAVLGVNDSFLILGLGLIELGLLFSVGEVIKQSWSVKRWLLPVCGFFGVMVFVDAFLPERMAGRLAVEDLSKTWATAFLLIYAWQYCTGWVFGSSRKESNGT